MDSLHIAVVILNYNSENDLQICAEQIAGQQGVRLSIVLVDNASRPESLQAIKTLLATWRPDAVCGTENAVNAWVQRHPAQADRSGNVYLIENNENRGYSAGNNIGIRLAESLGADAVLIVNPDMRIENASYLKALSNQMFSDKQNLVVASRIFGLDGNDQNPQREATFWEECLWPLMALRQRWMGNRYVMNYTSPEPVTVQKVSGCCLLIRMSFLESIGNLDENVFLYCEEAILSKQVQKAHGVIRYIPDISATHAHISTQKGNSSHRMRYFIQSRLYYLKKYSEYSSWRLTLLKISYVFLSWKHGIRN